MTYDLNVDPITVVQQLVVAINRGDWAAVRLLLHAEFRRYSLAAGGSGEESAADFVEFLQNERRSFPDAREEILDLFAAGDKVAARHLFAGTLLGPLGAHRPNGNKVQSVYIALYRVENGHIKEAWAEWDNLADLRQLGLAPDGAQQLQ
jgi:predicted ester cyclase